MSDAATGHDAPSSAPRPVALTDGDELEAFAGPAWFRRAIAARAEVGNVEVAGCTIAYRAWGEPGSGVVLVHGGAAHSRWWDHIAPWLATEYRVVALDLSGHGDSGRRSAYDNAVWAREALAAAAAGGISGRPVVIGHSMGGGVAIMAGGLRGRPAGGVIVIDSAIRRPDPEDDAAQRLEAFGPLRQYPSKETAIAHFRTVPEQPSALAYVLAHIAAASVTATERGWTWKFDPAIFDRPRASADDLKRVSTRVALLRAEHGLMTSDIGSYMYELLGRSAPVIEVPLAGHHVMLDQPISLVVALRSVLADWRHSSPQRRAVSSPPRGRGAMASGDDA